MATAAHHEREHVHLISPAEWRAWLAERHASSTGVWLVSWTKATGRQALTYDEAVEEALAFGWVDSTPGKVDDGAPSAGSPPASGAVPGPGRTSGGSTGSKPTAA